MEIKEGQIVFSRAGHDKGQVFVITAYDEKFAYICDGKQRLLEKPKKKKLIHLALTKTVLQKDEYKTNRQLKKSLAVFKDQNRSD